MKRLEELLQEATRCHGDRVAVEFPERDERLTYKELDGIASELGDLLVHSGVGPGDRVGIWAPKSMSVVASIFGALRAGAAYVPLDPAAPVERNLYIAGNCDVAALLIERSRLAELPEPFLRDVECLEAVELGNLRSDLMLLCPRRGESAEPVPGLAYILYTSGSTGNPKGVMLSHSNALSFLDWCSETFQPTKEDRFASHAPFHFDLSILDLFAPLKHGGCVALIGEQLARSPKHLGAFMADAKLSIWYSTPSILRLLAQYGRLEQRSLRTLRAVLFAGEVFPLEHLRSLKRLLPRPRYYNLYGPTETNVCTFLELPLEISEDKADPSSIGTTCSHLQTRVVDDRDHDLAPGQEGELCVSGPGVMMGYWGLPEQNRRAFLHDEAGTRWYRTGDLVVQQEAGGYCLRGRRDRMVKRRGYRVELGEIEAKLYRHEAVQDAAVIAIPDDEDGVRISAFVSCKEGAEPTLFELKSFCAEILPAYMVPDRISFEPQVPKTSTDKVDYQALRQMSESREHCS